jgi:hypothetical protein
MSRRRTFASVLSTAGLVLALASAAGCKQGEGERCEVPSDCSSGLTCRISPTLADGICTAGSGGAEPIPDAAPPAATPDSGGTAPDQAAPAPDVAVVTDTAPVAPDVAPDAPDSSGH